MAASIIRAKVDETVKQEAEAVLASMDLTVSEESW